MITEFAPAKINLCLHVTGRRADGYHLLDSLVVFAGVGDSVSVKLADHLSLAITGPMAANLPITDDNLVLRAARAFGAGQGAAITLDKHLPVASGIGGGSADAAATLRALTRLWGAALPAALPLGADVPVCLSGKPARMQGIGDHISFLPHALPPVWVVLANPMVAVPTPAVFAALTSHENPPMTAIPASADAVSMANWLSQTRNDLEPAAIKVAPVIANVKAAIGATDHCLLARMSGSGATCFGLYGRAADAANAARTLRKQAPAWWVSEAQLLS
ncbi:MAG: 4-(cytidine 5'-diphospho)-2-C-methyl-D-erythritol kinase [Paracoccaceae bacterium]